MKKVFLFAFVLGVSCAQAPKPAPGPKVEALSDGEQIMLKIAQLEQLQARTDFQSKMQAAMNTVPGLRQAQDRMNAAGTELQKEVQAVLEKHKCKPPDCNINQVQDEKTGKTILRLERVK